jgi:hypothetical protein
MEMKKKLWLLPIAISLLVLPGISTWADDFLVTNLEDSGAGSLRQAMTDANALPGPHLIEFEAGLSGTLLLASSLPVLVEPTVITGPGSDQITIDGNGAHQAFVIDEDVSASISHLTITNGQSDLGGGIINLGELNLDQMVITANSAQFGGGGISNEGVLVVSNSVISMNSATDFGIGGGIENFGGTLLIMDSMVLGNSADFGGGIDNAGQLQILRSTIANNQAELGGAIGNTEDLLIFNSTLSGNSADSGGGIDNFGGQLELVNATIADNTANDGGGIWTNVAFTVKSSLIVANPDSEDCSHDPALPPVSLGSNLDTDGSCTGFQTVSEQALGLDPLGDNGGSTLTHALSESSAAVEAAGDCTEIDGTTPVVEDQRGMDRPQGQACDIGAYELQSTKEEDVIFADAFESN